MKVIKRDGRTELLDITKIQKYTSSAVKDLVGVSQSELEVDAKILFKDGITTEEIQQTLIKTAVDKIDIDTPNWTFVASRLFLYDLYHKVSGFTGYKHLRDYFEKGMNENKILKGFSNKYDLDLLNDYIKPERDLQFNYLGIKTLYDRYLLKDRDDKPIELPQHMFMAIAMFLAQNEKDCNKKAMEFYDVLSKFEVMVATPTLSNARTPRHQLSSCYVGSMPDNIEGIFDSYKEMALLSKYGGGIGYDVSKIRGLGSYIDNHKNVSGGVVPFLKITNDIAVAVDQLGCVAKDGHVIVLDYVKVKQNSISIDVKYYEPYIDKNYQIVPLSKVSADNYILSFNIRTGKPEFKRVLKTHKVIVEPKDQIKIVYEDGNYIITSNWHPLCIKENNKYIYKRSDSVKVGDIGVGNNGDKKIISIDNNPNVSSEYLDLTVDINNNYFCSTHNENGEFHLIHNTRRGAIAVYLEVWHTDVLDFIDLRKNSGEERRRAHDLFPALWICDLFMKRVQENGLWTLFDPYEVSILTDVYGDEFEAKYIEFENRDDIHKEVMSAKDLWKKILTNYFESGLPFLAFKDNANRCNPNNHSGIIRSSNLCVSGDTKILTKEYGYIEIEKVSGQILECWNGKEWSKTSIFQTSESQEVLEVELNNGVKGKFTPYHKWVVVENYKEKIVETKDLKPDMKIVKFDLPNNIKHGNKVMKSPYANGLYTAEGTEIINKHGRKCIMHLYDKKMELKNHLECMTSFSKVTNISNCKRITVRLSPNEMYDKFFIPDISFRLQDRIKWLEGLLDGDGYASSHSIQIASTNKTFIKELMLMLQELGVYSRIESYRDEGYYDLPKNDKTMEYQPYYCKKIYRLSIAGHGINRLVDLGFSPKRLQVRKGNFNRSAIHFVKIKSITNKGEKVATYCGNEPKLHRLMFNGVLTMNCTEIFQNTLPSNYSVAVHFEDNGTDYFEENNIVRTDDGIEKKANKLTSLDSINGRKIYAVEKIGTGGETAVCNLASINLSKVNTKEDIERVVPIAIRMLDNVIDLNFYPNLKVKYTNSRNRAIGLGVMGEAEMLAREQIEWGSNKHLNRIDEIMEYISFNAIDASSDLAKEKGNYLDYEGSNWSKGILPIDLANKNALELLDRPLSCDWNSLKDKVKSQGIRNGYLMAIAPTSSISILVGTTQTIEPIYKKKWLEENLSGMIPNVVPNLNLDTYNYYVSAYSLDQRDIIKVASIRQKWIDQGQSVNIFMEIDKASGKYLNDIYMLAWELGLKSTYYLRSQSPDVKDEAMDRSIECYNCQ